GGDLVLNAPGGRRDRVGAVGNRGLAAHAQRDPGCHPDAPGAQGIRVRHLGPPVRCAAPGGWGGSANKRRFECSGGGAADQGGGPNAGQFTSFGVSADSIRLTMMPLNFSVRRRYVASGTCTTRLPVYSPGRSDCAAWIWYTVPCSTCTIAWWPIRRP